MKKIFTLCMAIIFSLPAISQAPYFGWAINLGNVMFNHSLMTDAAGNLYSAGTYSGTTDLDPGPGVYNITGNGAYIYKLNSSSGFLWAKAFIGTGTTSVNSMTFDASGNLLLAGNFGGTIDFDPGAGVYNLTATGSDIFVCKLDNSGNFIWAKAMSGTMTETGSSIASDALENIYTTGYFQGTVDFDPGTGTFNLTSAGQMEIFVAKLDSSGNFIWAKAMGGTLNDFAMSIAVDAIGNVYTAGYFYGTSDFDPGTSVFNLICAGQSDHFLSKLDSAGNFVWVKQTGSSSYDQNNQMIMDASYNLFSTGYFSGTVDFDPGPGVYNLTSAGGIDIFVSKVDSSGNLVWAKRMGASSTDDYGNAISVDNTGNIYLTGGFGSTVDFDPGPGVFNLTSAGNYDVFVCKLDTMGNFGWAVRMGASYQDRGYYIAAGTLGAVYTTGTFDGNIDFDPGPSVYNLNSGSNSALFLQKLADFPTGIAENETGNEFYFSPNPVTNELRIKNSELRIERIEIYDVLGEKTFSQKPAANSQEININVSEFTPGIYFVKVKGDQEERVAKFVKQ